MFVVIEPSTWQEFLQWVNRGGFSWRDLLGQDKWTDFTPVFGSLTVIGATTYSGRFRIVGRSVDFNVSFKAATSIASVAGTDYLTLPVPGAQGMAGVGVMTNGSTNIAVGVCHLEPDKCFLPTQAASGNTFRLSGQYQI